MLPPYRHCVKKEGIIDEGILDELAKAIRRQRCALLIGLGLVEVDEDLPQRDLKELLRRMVQWCVENRLITQKEVEDDFKETLAKETLEASELEKIERKIKEEYFTDADQRRQCMIEVLLLNPADIRYIYRLLVRMSFRAYFTAGNDKFLEKASEDEEKSLLKYDKASIQDALSTYQIDEPFILKLHGDAAKDNSEGITLSSRFANSQISEPNFYPQQLRELLADVHTLFVGFETADPDFQGLKSAVNKKDDLKRWLLLPDSHIDEEKATELWVDDKITILSYSDRSELLLFLRKLEEVVVNKQQIEVYISYAPEDHEIQERLQKHLCVIDYPGLKIAWSDGKIGPGQERKQIIEERLKNAQVILLLVSVDYLSSIKKSNIKIEMTRAVQRHHQGEARVIPIIVKSCPWKYAPFANLGVLPSDGKPIDLALNTDQILLEVAEAIKLAIEEWVEKH
jgi:SIR2-like domain/TIR domain